MLMEQRSHERQGEQEDESHGLLETFMDFAHMPLKIDDVDK